MKKLLLLSLISGLMLISCSKSKNPEPVALGYTITGLAELGVFDTASTTCQAFNLNEKLETTGPAVTFSLQENSSFRFLIPESKYISAECTGRYHNVLQGGALTKDTIKLEAIGNITNNTKINLNLATSLTKAKVKDDFNSGKPFSDTYKKISKGLFAAAGIKDPNIIPTDLDLTNPELQALSRWFLETMSLNPTHPQIDVSNAYSDAIQHSKAIKLPSGFANIPPPPSMSALGVNTKIGGSPVTSSPTGIDLNKAVGFELDVSSVKSFDPAFHHVLLSGKTGVKAIELQSKTNQFISTDVFSLFDGNKQTGFKVCVVSKTMDTCNSAVANQVQTFIATGKAIPTIQPLSGHTLVAGEDVSSRKNRDITKEVPFLMDKNIVRGLTANLHILIENNSGPFPLFLELTDDGQGHYSNPDIGNLLENGSIALLRVCIVSKSTSSCSAAVSPQMQMVTVPAENIPDFKLVQKGEVFLVAVIGGHWIGQELVTTNPVLVDPTNVGSLQIAHQIIPTGVSISPTTPGGSYHIIVSSDKPGTVGKELTVSKQSKYEANLTSLMTNTGSTVFKVCLVKVAINTCSKGKGTGVTFTLTAK